jgi:type III secretion protein U
MSEKTEKPTPDRLEQARRRGQLARSPWLSTATQWLGAGVGGAFALGSGLDQLRQLTRASLLGVPTDPAGAVLATLEVMLRLAVPSLLGACAGALAAGIAQAGLRIDPSLVAPQLVRLDPAAGLRRLFSWRAAAQTARQLALAALLGWALAGPLRDAAPRVWSAPLLAPAAAWTAISSALLALLWRLTAALLILGLLDFAIERWRHRRSLRMSRRDLQQERRRLEGDPRHKQQRRAAHRQLSSGGAARGLSTATALVVNPTHVAVALRYHALEASAPYLVAKASGDEARALREEAFRRGIPVIQQVPLARALHAYSLGEEIPEALYPAAARVIRLALDGPHLGVELG